MLRGMVCAVAAAVLVAPTADATPLPPAPATVWVAHRVSPHARQVQLNANFNWDRRSGRVTYAAVKMVNGRPRPYDAMTFDAPLSDGPAAYHDGASYGCYAGSVCQVTGEGGITDFNVMAPPTSEQPDRIYLAVSGLTAEVQLVDSPGWRLTRTAMRVRYVTSDTGGTATGVQVLGEHVERFGKATLPGGRRGSIAVATPPCRPLHRVGVYREGHGTATLTGGTVAQSFDCRANLHDLTAAADRATTWTFSGDVVGTAMGTTRLAVIDL